MQLDIFLKIHEKSQHNPKMLGSKNKSVRVRCKENVWGNKSNNRGYVKKLKSMWTLFTSVADAFNDQFSANKCINGINENCRGAFRI